MSFPASDAFTVENHADRAAWLLARRSGIGSSDAPNLWTTEIAKAGRKTYGSPMTVYADKTTAASIDDDAAERFRIGTLVEPVVATLYEQATGDALIYPGPWTILRSREWPWMTCSLDRVIDRLGAPGPGVLECKYRGGGFGAAGDWTDYAPIDVGVQVAHQLAVTGWGWGVAAALVGGFVHHEVARDDGFIAEHVERCSLLWERIQTEEPPEADGHPETGAALARIFPDSDGDVDLPEMATWAGVYEGLGKEITELETVRRHARNRIMRAMGDAATATIGEARYKLSTVERKAYEVAAGEHKELRKIRGKGAGK